MKLFNSTFNKTTVTDLRETIYLFRSNKTLVSSTIYLSTRISINSLNVMRFNLETECDIELLVTSIVYFQLLWKETIHNYTNKLNSFTFIKQRNEMSASNTVSVQRSSK